MNKDEIVASIKALAQNVGFYTDSLEKEREQLYTEKNTLYDDFDYEHDKCAACEVYELNNGKALAETDAFGGLIKVEMHKVKEESWPKYTFRALIRLDEKGDIVETNLNSFSVKGQSGKYRTFRSIPSHARKWFEKELKTEAEWYASSLLEKHPEQTKNLLRLITIRKRIKQIDLELKQYRIDIPGTWSTSSEEKLRAFAEAVENFQVDFTQIRVASV